MNFLFLLSKKKDQWNHSRSSYEEVTLQSFSTMMLCRVCGKTTMRKSHLLHCIGREKSFVGAMIGVFLRNLTSFLSFPYRLDRVKSLSSPFSLLSPAPLKLLGHSAGTWLPQGLLKHAENLKSLFPLKCKLLAEMQKSKALKHLFSPSFTPEVLQEAPICIFQNSGHLL